MMKPIPVTVYEPSQQERASRGDPTQGWVSDVAGAMRTARKEINVLPEQLQSNFHDFMASMEVALQGIPDILADYTVDKIELALEVTVSGELRLVAGVGVEGKAGITLKLSRQRAPAAIS